LKISCHHGTNKHSIWTQNLFLNSALDLPPILHNCSTYFLKFILFSQSVSDAFLLLEFCNQNSVSICFNLLIVQFFKNKYNLISMYKCICLSNFLIFSFHKSYWKIKCSELNIFLFIYFIFCMNPILSSLWIS